MPDRFDSLMDLTSAKNKGDGQVPMTPPEGGSTLADRYDGSANIGTVGADILIGADGRPLAVSGIQRQPPDVGRFG